MSAVQLGNGQVNVFADYRPVSGVLFPYRVMQGADAKAMSVFQASNVEPVTASPDAAAITRPTLPVDTATPSSQPSSPPGSK